MMCGDTFAEAKVPPPPALSMVSDPASFPVRFGVTIRRIARKSLACSRTTSTARPASIRSATASQCAARSSYADMAVPLSPASGEEGFKAPGDRGQPLRYLGRVVIRGPGMQEVPDDVDAVRYGSGVCSGWGAEASVLEVGAEVGVLWFRFGPPPTRRLEASSPFSSRAVTMSRSVSSRIPGVHGRAKRELEV